MGTMKSSSNLVLPEDSYKRQELYKKRKFLYLNFLLIGIVVNTFSIAISTSAQIIATKFHKENLMSSFQIAQFTCSIIMRVVHSKYLLKIKHKLKISGTCTFWTLVAITNYLVSMYVKNDDWGFGLYILSTLVFGLFQALADLTTIGYMKAFPPEVISGYAFGTGVGSIIGGVLSFIFGALEWDFGYLSLCMIPLNFLMVFCFFQIAKTKNNVDIRWKEMVHGDPEADYAEQLRKSRPGEQLLKEDKKAINRRRSKRIQTQEKILDEEESNMNQTLSIKMFRLAMSSVGWEIFNIFLVYYLEFLCIASLADRANPKVDDPSASWSRRNAYTIISLGYQIGVCISRGGFTFFKVRRIGIPTSLQIVNTVAFVFIAWFKGVNVYLQLVLMILVGLMGGTSYVNSLFLILEKESLKKSEREIIVNFAAMGYDLGILLSGVTALFIARWVFP